MGISHATSFHLLLFNQGRLLVNNCLSNLQSYKVGILFSAMYLQFYNLLFVPLKFSFLKNSEIFIEANSYLTEYFKTAFSQVSFLFTSCSFQMKFHLAKQFQSSQNTDIRIHFNKYAKLSWCYSKGLKFCGFCFCLWLKLL